jgi:excinuclease ABC subunit C
MRELLSRRIKTLANCSEEDIQTGKCEKPDLILIDGGKGQLAIACEVLDKYSMNDIPIIGLAKEFEEIFIPHSKNPIIIPKNNEGLHLLQRVRDEAHRFAVTYHRKLRSKAIEGSELDDIIGVGKTRKINLLKHFGDIKKIKKASVDEIANVKGLNKKVAKSIYNYFH